jgi:hypothetical protein
MPAGLSGELHTRLLRAEALGAIRDCERRYIAALNKMQPAGVNWRALLQSSPIRGTSRIGAFGVDLGSTRKPFTRRSAARRTGSASSPATALTQYA